MESIKYLIHQVRRRAYRILFVVGEEETTDMSHVDGVDDGVGYGVSGKSRQRAMVCMARRGYGVVGESDSLVWCVWQEQWRVLV